MLCFLWTFGHNISYTPSLIHILFFNLGELLNIGTVIEVSKLFTVLKDGTKDLTNGIYKFYIGGVQPSEVRPSTSNFIEISIQIPDYFE